MGRKPKDKERVDDPYLKETWVKELATLYLQHGLGKFTMDKIAKKLNISKATLYKYFASKDEIIDAVKKCINDASFRASCRITNNPYYLGGAGKKIAKILAATSIDQKLLRKRMTLIGEAQDGWFR